MWFLKCSSKQKSLRVIYAAYNSGRIHIKNVVLSPLVILKQVFNRNLCYTGYNSGPINIKKCCGFLSCGFKNALFQALTAAQGCPAVEARPRRSPPVHDLQENRRGTAKETP